MEHDHDLKKNRLFAAVSYVPLLFLIPLLFKRDSKYAQFHGKQGLALFVAWFIVWLVGLVPYVGLLAFLGYVMLIVIGMIAFVKAILGHTWEVPFVGKYAERVEF